MNKGDGVHSKPYRLSPKPCESAKSVSERFFCLCRLCILRRRGRIAEMGWGGIMGRVWNWQ